MRAPAHIRRRDLATLAAWPFSRPQPLPPILVRLSILYDAAAHNNTGLSGVERQRFEQLLKRARAEYAVSSLLLRENYVEGAFLRTQGYSEIPERFLTPATINIFVSSSLAYDVDRNRTGGASIGPHGRAPQTSENRFYKTFIGLREASDGTLAHELAHHFTLDTRRNPTPAANLFADLKIDWWLWRQRHGNPIPEFRACANLEWARP